jgi:uncharacterized protein (TIGR02246 family)
MGAQRPEDIHQLFCTAFNEGNLDAIMALYEPQAALIPQPGQVTRGHTAIRFSLQQFLAFKGKMQMKTVFAIHGSDLALLRSQWKLNGTGSDGKPVEMVGQSIEVVRRQPNDQWLISIDHPFGAD